MVPKLHESPGHSIATVMPFHEFTALETPGFDKLGMQDCFFDDAGEGGVVGKRVYDGVVLFLADEVIELRFASRDGVKAVGHSKKCICGRGIAIHLVKHHVGRLQELEILFVREILHLDEFCLAGMAFHHCFRGSFKQFRSFHERTVAVYA